MRQQRLQRLPAVAERKPINGDAGQLRQPAPTHLHRRERVMRTGESSRSRLIMPIPVLKTSERAIAAVYALQYAPQTARSFRRQRHCRYNFRLIQRTARNAVWQQSGRF